MSPRPLIHIAPDAADFTPTRDVPTPAHPMHNVGLFPSMSINFCMRGRDQTLSGREEIYLGRLIDPSPSLLSCHHTLGNPATVWRRGRLQRCVVVATCNHPGLNLQSSVDLKPQSLQLSGVSNHILCN